MKKSINASKPVGEDVALFAGFGLNDYLLNAVSEAGFTAPSPIQARVIPLILQGRDVVGQAKTGTGKTAAFALPALHFIDPTKSQVQLLVITPTRELATQVSEEIQKFGRSMGVKVVTIYGGSSYSRQIEGVRRGAHVVVATPGRLLDLLQSKRIGEIKPKLVVLDEADEMLDMGFLEDIQTIFEFLDENRQTLLFSATMPKPIQKLAKEILSNPEFVSVESEGGLTNQNIEQRMCLVADYERDDAIARLIDSENPHKSIIFCRTRGDVDRVHQSLLEKGYSSASLHGDIEQRQREKVINGFREGRVQILVATDVAARGLNVLDVSHVFNYHLPTNAETYVHRIGRTGRAGRKGIAYSLLTPAESQRVRIIKQVTGGTIGFFSIPSLKEVRKSKMDRLTSEVSETDIHEEAESFVAKLMSTGTFEDVTAKIVSLFLSRIAVSGPERIGHSADRLKDMISFDPRGNRGGDRKSGRPFRGRKGESRNFGEKADFRPERRRSDSSNNRKFDQGRGTQNTKIAPLTSKSKNFRGKKAHAIST